MNMIPQIAQHPRHVSQHFGTPGFAVPPFESLSSPGRFDPPAPLPFRSIRESNPSAPSESHRAYPLESHAPRRTGLARGSSSEQGFGSQYNDPSEHMLRRKTPNGTLAAGYDGTPVQWSTKAPALKHVILPLSGNSSNRSGVYSPSTSNTQHSRQRSRASGWSHQQPTQYAGVHTAGGERIMAGEIEKWTQLPQVPDSSHNVWDHIGIHQAATYYPNNGTHIPTVLQPAFQPCPGPTASNDGGLYGPYWPDGKFVPYRPAAFRGQGNIYMDQAATYQPPTPGDLLSPFRQPSTSLAFDPLMRARNASFQFQQHDIPMIEQRFETPNASQPVQVNNPLYLPVSEGSRTPTAEFVNKASNHRFKEKTLSWAHSIYVELLAYLHQSKKNNRNSNQPQGSRSYSKTSIYPKPPRQSASYLGTSQWAGLHSGSSEGNVSRQVSPMLPPTPRSSGSSDYNGWQTGDVGHSTNSTNDIRQYMSPFQASHFAATNPLNKAKEALDLLTSLCEQSGWSWIDGMLLGGCLAYGLEQYDYALEWYSKIISLDSM